MTIRQKQINIIVCALIGMLILIVSALPVAAQVQTYDRYAYISGTASGETHLYVIDASNSKNASEDHMVLASNNSFPSSITVSPQKSLIALFVPLSNSYSILKLNRISSGESIDVAQGSLLYNMSWSDDERYLAFNERTQTNQLTTFIYSVGDKRLASISSGTALNRVLAWSKDDTQLSIATETCDISSKCSIEIAIFDRSTNQMKNRMDVSYVSQGSSVIGDAICQLQWSPNGNYISFVGGCSLDVEGTVQEVYVWDLLQNRVIRATNFTVDALKQVLKNKNSTSIAAKYETHWYNSQILLIAAVYSDDSNATHSAFLSYQTDNGMTNDLSLSDVEDITLNPTITSELAFRNATTVDALFTSQNPEIYIASFDGKQLKVLTRYSGGCDLSWSPDGTTLAYTQRGDNTSCLDPIQAINFLHPMESAVQTHSMSAESAVVPEYAIPIGWIIVNQP